MMFSLLYLFLFTNPLNVSDAHEIYISVLEIDRQEIKIKVFTDNLQDAIRNHSKAFTPASEVLFLEKNQPLIEAYFQEKIQLRINEDLIGLHLTGASLESDSYWITMRIEAPTSWKSFRLQADYLMELFPDQTNVVKIVATQSHFFRLTKRNPPVSYDCKTID